MMGRGFMLLGLWGCQEKVSYTAACSFPSDIASGTGEAEVDGEFWGTEDVAWNETSAGLQITTGMSDGWRLTVVVNEDSLNADGLGSVELDGSGGWALLYPETGSSYSSQEGFGALELVSREDTLRACMEFEASGAEGEVVLENGFLHAEILDLGG